MCSISLEYTPEGWVERPVLSILFPFIGILVIQRMTVRWSKDWGLFIPGGPPYGQPAHGLAMGDDSARREARAQELDSKGANVTT